ncbi:MAG: hypothetical protein Q8T04_09070, partial [Bacteroidota bacterium]|nr:hypothetical protein [Bacteroidota bacterium]
MNKKIITGLIALMGISIIGIIIIQLVWMNNAIRVKNELFDRSVNEALTSAINRLETMQDFRMINHFAFSDSMHFRGIAPLPPVPPNILNRVPGRIIIPKRPSAKQIEMIVKAGKNRNGFQYQISTKGDSLNSEIENIVVINSDSIIQKLGSVYAHGINKFDSLVGQFQTWTDSAGKLKQRMEFKTRQMKRLADKAVREISTWEEDVPIERVNEVLKKELENRNIPIPFELGIIKDSIFTDKSVTADTLLL